MKVNKMEVKREFYARTRIFLKIIRQWFPSKCNSWFSRIDIKLYSLINGTYTPEERMERMQKALDEIKRLSQEFIPCSTNPNNENENVECYRPYEDYGYCNCDEYWDCDLCDWGEDI